MVGGGWKATGGFGALAFVSLLDVFTTELGLSAGAYEYSPGVRVVYASLGLAGFVWLKAAAVGVAWGLRMVKVQSVRLGVVVPWGLGLGTAVAVVNNAAWLRG